jgi:hypothetical protein
MLFRLAAKRCGRAAGLAMSEVYCVFFEVAEPIFKPKGLFLPDNLRYKLALCKQDFEFYGYSLSVDKDGILVFKKETKPFETTLMYNTNNNCFRLRNNNPTGRHATIIGGLTITNRQELDWLFQRIPHEI